MSDTAQRFFATIRRALGREASPDPEAIGAERRALMAAPAPRPEWSGDDVTRLLTRLEAAAATSERIASPADIPAAVARVLLDAGAPGGPVQLGADPLLAGLEWPQEVAVADGIDGVHTAPASVTVAVAGIAETGTLVLRSGPDNPTSLNFLPEHHVVVLRAGDVVDYMETAWARLHADGDLPRTVNFITGPSRTGDVEQTIELGAHGPRRLHVLLLEDHDQL
ncbi:Lactate utilization protein C [wastewater metagenome]|uniref:Lactate utilization protein C n=2 Tax=unclassified sequences TaxID=12908 RepID=A0A5B8R7R0_9ZZZZ|nr:LUD domain-containing protein [Arhodomonas sp. KWT]QEA05159.1 lactate utilization protein C [uncultured organism]